MRRGPGLGFRRSSDRRGGVSLRRGAGRQGVSRPAPGRRPSRAYALRRAAGWALGAALCLALAGAAGAQVLNPKMDAPGRPFSYPAYPTTEIGLQGAPQATEITPEGYLYTGYGELMFLLGDPAHPAQQRIRTLDQGYLPIVQYPLEDGAVEYRLTLFTAASGPDDAAGVNIIRVRASNDGDHPRTSYFAVALRYTGDYGAHRFYRPAAAAQPGDYSQPGVHFDPHWVYAFDHGLAERSGQVLYAFPTAPAPTLWLTRRSPYRHPAQIGDWPQRPVLMAQYELHLAPGQTQTLVFKMPVAPVAAKDAAAIASLQNLVPAAALAATRAYWDQELHRGLRIHLAEPKVTDTFQASLMYDLLALNHVGGEYIQTVNQLQYHAFWLRDGSNIMHAYDVMGYAPVVKECLPFFLQQQKPDGLFISQRGQYDGWGQALWAFGEYYRYSHDRKFARQVLPAVTRAVAWLERARARDPLHIMPASNPGDDEFTHTVAHVTGFNFWALAGLRAAVELASAAGQPRQAAAFTREYQNYHHVFFQILDRVAAKNGGYMPPGLDVSGGQDWGNMDGLYPVELMPPFDPKITATLAHTRAEYAEGLMTYGGRLHHYITMKNTESEIIRGQQKLALQDLYAILLHTSSTQAGFEWGVKPWATRDYGQDLAPHGWFAAEYMIMLRNMLVRGEKDDLHLLSVVSPAWSQPGESIRVDNAPTRFGRISFRAWYTADGMALQLQPQFYPQGGPKQILIHLPWFVTAMGATVDGRPARIQNGVLAVPPTTRGVTISWNAEVPPGNWSYEDAVAAYEQEYAHRYREFRRDGAAPEKPIHLQ